MAAVLSPYAPFLGLASLAFSVLQRRIFLSLAATVMVAVTLAVQIHWYYWPAERLGVAESVKVRVLSANLRKGQADPDFIASLADSSIDVLTVSELTPEEAQRLVDSGIEAALPYSVLRPEPNAGGIGLWSRFPVTPIAPTSRKDISAVAARLSIPGTRHDPVVASLHVTSPITAEAGSFRRWQRGIASAKKNLRYFADLAGQAGVIVAGDFNSTPDMRQFRDLLDGYRDAVKEVGAGWLPTFPSRSWHPPAITIDHVLTRNTVTSAVKTLYVPGSDHRALLASVQVPAEPKASQNSVT
ncbi:endonuclease/exonuclease/phosphatase [Mycolicibacterium phlei RIVM601174]|nr:endonuclease/exonuclease/phosphatase [Mycolicibacterium phlei RIVM601174]MBF4191498.1 endonuclease/exonuclease/phosphatase [Mycolicibacterium phlei]